ncbi:DinB family protein [Agriterribacter sp.]|uniref:DinB family protein n=1 Tax=Agriterribacter sp. TaxID=2821509 RepID=UPI002CD42A01|nr:DinB family protein [Agriterribacter sp.]HRO47259.1 DinB family protein [Agriterribacter sp.]HRQ19280.1 DinB family protein [Agriterribacter sp.]
MTATIHELQAIVEKYSLLLAGINEANYTYKPLPHKWSKKEILGHLVDSAQNNIRRFIVAQYEDEPRITYQQDEWVSICNYKEYCVQDLIQLWQLLNRHICVILNNTSSEKQNRTVCTSEPHTIAWVAEDYNKHLLHHLHQVLDMEPVAYP